MVVGGLANQCIIPYDIDMKFLCLLLVRGMRVGSVSFDLLANLSFYRYRYTIWMYLPLLENKLFIISINWHYKNI